MTCYAERRYFGRHLISPCQRSCRPPTPAFHWLIAAIIVVGLPACTSAPSMEVGPDYRARVESRTHGDVTVSASILSPAEADTHFAIPLSRKAVQPVWIEIENRGEDDLMLMLLSIDPDYFSPSEVAWMYRRYLHLKYEDIVDRFLAEHIPIVIPGGSSASGFVYTNLTPGAKAFSVELWTEGQHLGFDFAQLVPGFEADFSKVEFSYLYPEQEYRELDRVELRRYLERLPCCVMGPDATTPGDPLNLVIVGDGEHMLATLVRRGWDLTETMRRDTVWKTVASSVFRSQYRTSPVSPLFLFDRSQDISLQKTRGSVDERNHLRLWLAPVTHRGRDVWLGQISRDIGVKLSRKTLVTHKIDPIVDEARLYILLDMAASRSLAAHGHVQGVGLSTRASPRENYTRDPYYTDGLRVVLILSEDFVPLEDIKFLDWADPTATRMTTDIEKVPREAE